MNPSRRFQSARELAAAFAALVEGSRPNRAAKILVIDDEPDVELMMKQRSGAIVNITSVVGLVGNAGQANYSAAKAGVVGLTKSIARELASRGVRANAVAPGFIETDMTAKLSEAVCDATRAQIAMGTFGSVEDVANAVSFLAGDDARYITGQVLAVDGGMTFA